MKVFVIIVTYKGQLWYDRCFKSLRESEIFVHTVVVDNASNDGTVEYIRENYPEVHLIASDVNLGFGQGNNKGMKYALDNGADYVFLLNQDAWIEPETIKKLIEVHENYPEYGIISPMHLNADKTAIEKGLFAYLTYPDHINKELISDFYIGLKKSIYEIREVNAAAWLLPRQTLEIVGGFDPLFFHYAEDDNYMSRVLFHKLKIGIVPGVTICHDTERTIQRTKKQSSSFDKWLLQRSADILYDDNQIDTMIKNYFKQAVSKLITLHWNTFRENRNNFIFLLKNKKKIIESRNANKNKGRTWI